ncbi:hypothetical protein [Actinokineospora cianjurensis]|uniref:Uncharacterized protein n=1 Tax=Actinokineospora cianjurensis TaxID=585224 RepID=A0A421B304_9PSEU|nr:hypothetical protein [Actinokineospora cianjurensis]RLK58759.1 hypothetical protein CLV68_3234 [Actinokineospora cianjurensis]
MAQQEDVVELYLTEVAEDRRPLWDDLLELPRYVESVRVDMAAFRGFLGRLGVHRILAEATRVRVVGTVREDIHDHRVPDRVITLHLGGLLKGIDRARRVEPGLTDPVAAERVARAMSDAMIHLGGHLSSDVDAGTPLDRDVTFAGKVGKAIGFLVEIGVTAVFVALLAFEETYMYLFIAEIFAFPYLGYRAGRHTWPG